MVSINTKPLKIECESDCGKTFIMTRDNRWWALYKRTLEPYTKGSKPIAPCPYCGNLLNFYNPYDDGETWRIED
jgi:hypothetical protein